MDRRSFLKVLAGGTFGVAYGYGLFPRLAAMPAAALRELGDDALRPPEERWIPSICQQCPGGCGILVRAYGDRAVKIDGNPLHPISRGRLCARGQAALQLLYDPDRIRGPMVRVGERGAGKWRSVSWDVGLAAVAKPLAALRAQGRAHFVAMLTGPPRGLDFMVGEWFMESYGSPNLIPMARDRAAGRDEAVALMQGGEAGVTHDIENATYILSLNSGLLERHWSAVQLARAYGRFRRGRSNLRGRFVHFEPRLSVTGAKADEWVPLRPGSEGVLANGIASVLIREGRYDRDFVQERVFGFEDWRDEGGALHPGYQTLLLRYYPMERVEEESGVGRETITRIAREFSRSAAAVAIGPEGGALGAAGLHGQMAVHALNALVGNLQRKGGVLSRARMPTLSLPPVTPDAVAARSLAQPPINGGGGGAVVNGVGSAERLAARLASADPYPVEAVILRGANPLFDAHPQASFLGALDRVGLVVSLASFLDETTVHADVVLPDSTPMERWQLDTSYTLQGQPVVNLGRPVVPPTFDTRDANETLMAVAQRIGAPVSDRFPVVEPEALIKGAVVSLHAGGSGEPFGAPLEEAWTTLLEQSGWRVPHDEPFETFWEGLTARGGWWDPVYYRYEWGRVLATPSGRFELRSQRVAAWLSSLPESGREAALHGVAPSLQGLGTELLALPLAVRDDGAGDAAYDLEVNPYPIPILSGLAHTNEPWLQDITGFHLYRNWETWVEIHPQTAGERGFVDGERVWVESPSGRVLARLRLFPGAMPGVINLPVGLGHTSGGRCTAGIGDAPQRILATGVEPLTGATVYRATRARLLPVEER